MPLWREYAVEPSLFDDYTQARLILSGFGVDRGRLIAAFPRKWQREVMRQLTGYSDMQRKIFIEKLNKLDSILVPRAHPYDSSISWREQAFDCDITEPFHAIITNGADVRQKSIDGTGDLESMPLWQVNGKASIPRSAKELAATLKFLLEGCNEILIIDREFMPSGGTGDKWLKPIQWIAQILASQGRVTRFELHSLDKPHARWPAGKFSRDCSQHLPRVVPKGLSMTASLWGQKSAGIQFHERLIVTDRGGVLLDPGIDEGKAGETYDIRLLSNVECDEYFGRFDRSSTSYDLIESIEIQGART
jgi:hypothetical protein